MELYEWTKHYIKFKDQFKKQIQKTTYETNLIIVKTKTETIKYFITEKLENSIKLKNKEKNEKTILVCLNSKENLKTITTKWDELINEQLTIIFVNPKTNEKWLIQPKTHNKIAEKIKDSLKILYESINSIN